MAPVKKPPHARKKTYLREWRQFREMTLEGVAEKVDLDHSTLQRIEVGKVPYNQDLLEKLSYLYMCQVTDLTSVDPTKEDPIGLLTRQLREAPERVQKQVVVVVDAMLKSQS